MFITFGNLKNLIKESANKSDLASNSFFKKVFEHYGFQLIASGGNDGFLGEGQYSTVFEGLYKKKHSVLKIAVEGEADSYRAIKNIYDSLPNMVKRHLPKIFVAEQVNIDNNNLDIIISEYLHPVPNYLKHEFDVDSEVFSEKYSDISTRAIFPPNIGELESKSMIDSSDPRVKSLFYGLQLLQKKFGISWNDVHVDNIMYRPSTDSIVVVDLGLFFKP